LGKLIRQGVVDGIGSVGAERRVDAENLEQFTFEPQSDRRAAKEVKVFSKASPSSTPMVS